MLRKEQQDSKKDTQCVSVVILAMKMTVKIVISLYGESKMKETKSEMRARHYKGWRKSLEKLKELNLRRMQAGKKK